MEKKYNYDILFIGGLYEEGKEDEYLSKTKLGGIQNAVNIHQWNFIHGLDYNNQEPVQILSARYVNSFPQYSEIYVKKNNWHHQENSKDENIGFLNIKVLKNIERKAKLKIKAKKWAKENNNKSKVIICYYPSIPQMVATINAKKTNKDIKTILIVPDIPQYLNLSSRKSFIKKIKDDIIEKESSGLIKQFDKYVVLTKFMPEKLGIDKKDCIVIEGISNVGLNEIDNNTTIKKNKNARIVLYSGSLHEKYGIRNYIDAIQKIKAQDIEFYIFGNGEMEEEIKELSKRDSRIKFMGYCPHETILEYQKKADLLVNPRVTDEEFVKYSFPSKLIEYMSSGTPVLTTKLTSIPEEYYPYLFFIGDAKPETISNGILDALQNEKLKKIGYDAVRFIAKEKNNIIQTKRILEIL